MRAAHAPTPFAVTSDDCVEHDVRRLVDAQGVAERGSAPPPTSPHPHPHRTAPHAGMPARQTRWTTPFLSRC